jgi:hypothetical protein
MGLKLNRSNAQAFDIIGKIQGIAAVVRLWLTKRNRAQGKDLYIKMLRALLVTYPY